MDFEDSGVCKNIYFVQNDTSNPASYGTCDVVYGGKVEWQMANGEDIEFRFVNNYDDVLTLG
jgi:hypothetical protein